MSLLANTGILGVIVVFGHGEGSLKIVLGRSDEVHTLYQAEAQGRSNLMGIESTTAPVLC